MGNLKKNYKILAIGDIRLKTAENSQTEKILYKNRDAIEKIWQNTLKEKDGDLFNGTLPNFIRVDKKREKIEIKAHFIEYKHFLAQRKQPDLKLNIRPIGVSGIIVLRENSSNYVLFAKRANNVTEYPGFFELVPSGSIDKEYVDINGIVDYQSKLLSEFVEETGLSKDYVKEISGFAFVLDVNHNIYDVCCKILLEAKKESVASEFLDSKEYHTPKFISINDLGGFIEENADIIVPTSMALIEAYMRSHVPWPSPD